MFDTSTLFWLIGTATVVLVWIQNEMVMTESAYKTLLGNQLDQTRIRELVETIRLFSIASYVLIPIGLWLRFTIVALMIQFGLVLTNVEAPFKTVFRITLLSYLPLLFGAILKLIYLVTLDPAEINQHVLADFPLSLTVFLDSDHYSAEVFGFLAGVNLFEVLWITILSISISRGFSTKLSNSILFSSAIWTTILIFQWIIFIYAKNWLGF
jgi:hypothetical protein